MSTVQTSIAAPNYTQVPNAILDCMHEMEKAELKVLLAVSRKTFGWHKASDKVSLTQFEELTGLSRQSVLNGIEKAMERGFLVREPNGHSFVYSLHIAPESSLMNRPATSPTIRPTEGELVYPLDQLEPQLVYPLDTQKKETNKEIDMSSDGDRADDLPIQEVAARTSKAKPHTPRETVTPEQREMHAMMARVCKVDLDTATKEAKINLYRVCNLFHKKGHTAADIKTFGLWWYQEHWIGKQKKAPTLKQVQDTWVQAFDKGMPLEDEAERIVDPFERMLRQKSEELRRQREARAQHTQAAA